jgi:3-methyl-2-oxobutanoate hydroxymethyltransferase
VAARITQALKVPTIGIGAGPGCDGQVLVTHDLLGLYDDVHPRFVKQYAELGREVRRAAEDYCREVREGAFPAAEHSFR